MASLHTEIPDDIKQRLVEVAKRQSRPGRALVEDALRQYLARYAKDDLSDLDDMADAQMEYLDRTFPP